MIKYGWYLNVKDCEWKGKVLLTEVSATASHIGQMAKRGTVPTTEEKLRT